MKNTLTPLMAGFGLLLAGTADVSADHIKFKELPEAVQTTIKANKSGRLIRHIDREMQDGKTVYQVELRRWGKNPILRVGEDGTLLAETTQAAQPAPPTTEQRYVREPSPSSDVGVSLNNLPEPVQQTIKAQGKEVADIDKEMWSGKTVYEVEFKSEGKNPQIYIAEDGTLLKHEPAGTGVAGRYYLGTQLTDLPEAVQNSIKSQAGADKIVDIDKETRTGRTLYEVQFEREGKNAKIHFAEDGSVVQPPSTAVQVREALGLKKLQLSEVPTAVQNTINAQGVVAEEIDIKKKTKDGVTVYAVEFKQDGKDTKLEIGEDGTVLKDNRR